MTSVSWRSRSELEAEKERLGDWVEAHKSMVLSHDLERYRPFLEDTKSSHVLFTCAADVLFICAAVFMANVLDCKNIILTHSEVKLMMGEEPACRPIEDFLKMVDMPLEDMPLYLGPENVFASFAKWRLENGF